MTDTPTGARGGDTPRDRQNEHFLRLANAAARKALHTGKAGDIILTLSVDPTGCISKVRKQWAPSFGMEEFTKANTIA